MEANYLKADCVLTKVKPLHISFSPQGLHLGLNLD